MSTIYDIAKEACVSASTVSRVINNKPGISLKTREKIQALLEEHHYVPNDTARGLVTSSSRLIGILVADVRTQHHIEGAYHISRALAEKNYSSLILNTGADDEERANGVQLIGQRKVEAAVLMGSIFQTDVVKNAIAKYMYDTPIFMLNGYLDLPNVFCVLSDERNGVVDCVQFLVNKGKRNIAFLVDIPTPSSQLKKEGYIQGMQQTGHESHEMWIYEDIEGSINGGYKAFQRALAQHPDLDGIICSLDIIACGVLRALQENGMKVPQQVSVIGIDNSIYAEITSPRLTSLDNMIFDSSVVIAHKMLDCLQGLNTNKKTMLFTGIVERETT